MREFNQSPAKLNDTIDRLDTQVKNQLDLLQNEIATLSKTETESSRVHKQTVQLQQGFKTSLEDMASHAETLNSTVVRLNDLLKGKMIVKRILRGIRNFFSRPFVFMRNKFSS